MGKGRGRIAAWLCCPVLFWTLGEIAAIPVCNPPKKMFQKLQIFICNWKLIPENQNLYL